MSIDFYSEIEYNEMAGSSTCDVIGEKYERSIGMEKIKKAGIGFKKCAQGIAGLWKLGTVGVRVTLIAIPIIALLGLLLSSSALFMVGGKTTKLGLKDIGQLATQAGYYTNVEMIEGSREAWGWSIPFTQSKYIFSYDGTIKAGIDFAEIDVSVNEATSTIIVRLPEAKVLSNEIDEDSLEVYDESRSIFTPLTLDAVSKAKEDLKAEATESAIENGLLENAKTNAELLIKGFLASTYDMTRYTVVFE